MVHDFPITPVAGGGSPACDKVSRLLLLFDQLDFFQSNIHIYNYSSFVQCRNKGHTSRHCKASSASIKNRRRKKLKFSKILLSLDNVAGWDLYFKFNLGGPLQIFESNSRKKKSLEQSGVKWVHHVFWVGFITSFLLFLEKC